MANEPYPKQSLPQGAAEGTLNLRMRPEKIEGPVFRTRVRLPPSPPKKSAFVFADKCGFF